MTDWPSRPLRFINTTTGFGVEGAALKRTTDGGATWQSKTHPTRINLHAVHAQAAGAAWFAGANGLILRYSATQPPGCWATPTPAAPFAGTPPAAGNVRRQVSHCMDDAYVRVDTRQNLYDFNYVRMGAREAGAIPYVTGWLFRDIRIPRDAQITAARLSVELWYQAGSPIIAEIAAERQRQPDDFSSLNTLANKRLRTTARVNWTISGTAPATTDSPDISAVIQEIVHLPDWQPGDDIAILVSATGASQQCIDWKAYDFNPSKAGLLNINYQTAPPARAYLPVILK